MLTKTEDQKSSSFGEKAKKWKYRLIKAIDVSGLTFLTPIVRLCSGEQPKEQLKQIFRFIIVPVLAVALFLLSWNWIAPKHKTKSGEVPTPKVVWDAAQSIWTFHERENFKEAAYNLDGPRREQALAAVEHRLASLEPLEQRTKAYVAQVRQEVQAEVEAEVKPILEKHDELKAEFEAEQTQREAKLKTQAAQVKAGDDAAKAEYLQAVKIHLDTLDQQQELLKDLRAEADELRSDKHPKLVAAIAMQTNVAELKQYLTKMSQQLSSANRGIKLDQAESRLAEIREKFNEVQSDTEVYDSAVQIAKEQQRIEKLSAANYAKPWTLPMQVFRSIVCVFCGFLLGTLIAVPIGVLCGLSKTFMAAVTPFIALFKPVSPIVWLPIALIIVGGFIPNPDKHWLIQWLETAPLIGWMKINPAFMACAITVALCSLWATMVNTAFGVASIDKDHMNVARVLRLGFKDRLFKIIIPSALPLIFAGMRISLGVGWMVLIAAELLSSSEGIGKFVWDQFSNGASDSFAKMFVVVFAVGLVGLMLDRIMIVLQRLVSFDGAPASV